MTHRTPPRGRAGVRQLLTLAVIAASAVTLAAAAPATPAVAAPSNGTLVIIEPDDPDDDTTRTVYAVDPDTFDAHAVYRGDRVSSVSMDDDGVIYVADDPWYTDDPAMTAVTQDGEIVTRWSPTNPGQLEGGGIGDSEIRRDGARLLTNSEWIGACGGSSVCSIRTVSQPGSGSSLGQINQASSTSWLGNSDYLVVNGGQRYYRVGETDTELWFDDDNNSNQYYSDTTTTADGSVLVAAGDYEPVPESWDFNHALHFYSITAAPPAAPTHNCYLPLSDLISDWPEAGDHYGYYVEHLSFSPDGASLVFAAGTLESRAAFVIRGIDTDTCEYDEIEAITAPVVDVFWGHAPYQAPSDPGDPTPPVVPDGTVVMPVDPARYWDTRAEATFDGQHRNTGRMGDTHTIQIAGRGAVPNDAIGVVANLTAILPDGPGYATLYPCGDIPWASHVNYAPGQVVANSAIVPLNSNGQICVYSHTGADFALDVNGFIPATSDFAGITPQRYLDTRADGTTFDGKAQRGGAVAAGHMVEVQIAGRGDVPKSASAAFVNVTAVGPAGPGFVTLYPCGTRPNASTINYDTGQVVPNGALVNLSATGTLCVYTYAASHLIVDVAGFLPADTNHIGALTPARLADSRTGQTTADGKHNGFGRLDAGETIEIQVTGRGGVPTNATAATFNVAAINPAAPGFATLYPCGTRPLASNVNHGTGGVIANNAYTKLSAKGTVCVYTYAATDLIVDVTGWAG